MKTMKTMKFYLAIALLSTTTVAAAQFTNSNSPSVRTTAPHNLDTNGWSRISVSYNPVKIVSDYKEADDQNATGFSIGYTKGFNITKGLPLFVEIGINGLYAFNAIDAEDDDNLKSLEKQGFDVERKTTLFTLNIPVNLAYKFCINNSALSIVPYVGINLKGNLIGKAKYKLTNDLENSIYTSEKDFWEAFEEKGYGKEDTNMFDKKDTGSKDYTWNRFQMGWQIGVGVNYNKLYVGIGYGKDLTELCKKTKIGTTSITLGYNF